MNVDELLKAIEAYELIGGRAAWKGLEMSPYTGEELCRFASMDMGSAARLRENFERFQCKYDELSDNYKQTLAEWTQHEFVEPLWKNGRDFERPKFADRRFFAIAPRSGLMLDIAPAHGCHGALLYRDHYKHKLDLHTCDLLPCYNKLLTLLRVKVKQVDLRFDKLHDVYQQKFDVVTMTEVLEHVTQEVEDNLLAGLGLITRQGSMILITFPNEAFHGSGGKPKDNDPLGHIRQPSIIDIVNKLPSHGIRVVESGKFFGGKLDQRFVIGERT